MNIITLSGNLGADPEVFYSSEGNPIASFSLAFRSGKDHTGWMKVVAFKKLAEITEKNLKKGDRVIVSGSLDQEQWENHEGAKRTSLKVIANSIEFFHKTQADSDFIKEESEEVPL